MITAFQNGIEVTLSLDLPGRDWAWTATAASVESLGFSHGADFRVATNGNDFFVVADDTHEVLSQHETCEAAIAAMNEIAGF